MDKLLEISNQITICIKEITKENLIGAFELVKLGNQWLIKNDEHSTQEIGEFLVLVKDIIMTYTYKREFDTHQALADIEKEYVKMVLLKANLLKNVDVKVYGSLINCAAQCAYFDKELQSKLDQLINELP